MIIFANLLAAVAAILQFILKFFIFFLLGRVIISWVNADPYNPIVRAVCGVTDPVLQYIKKYIPTTFGNIDLAPIIIILIIIFLESFLVTSLYDYSTYFRVRSIQVP
jgi:YggT family protein